MSGVFLSQCNTWLRLLLLLYDIDLTRLFLLKDVRAKFSNIDFFLKILPLKDDELAMSEM